MTANRRFPAKVRVVDEQGNQARASVVCEVKDGNVAVSEVVFPYDKIFDDGFFNSNGFKGKPTMTKSGSYYETKDNLDLSK